jgi:ribosomal protein S18 acetylase RimI-like enzyme
MSAAFRAATPADVPAILAHQRDYYATDGYRFDETAAREAIAGLLADAHRGRLWVLSDAGAVVGYLAVTFGWSLEYQGRDAFVDELYVAPSHRGRGFGAAAMALADETCRAEGVRALHLEVEPKNVRARALYARSDFGDAGRILLTRWLTPPR